MYNCYVTMYNCFVVFSLTCTYHACLMRNQMNTSYVCRKKVGCVGKGLLFDTGGYNIKTSMVS